MANKKISDFTTITDAGGADLLLIDHNGTTYNTTVGSLTSNLGSNFIEKPASATAQQVLTYNGSTSAWVASAAPSNPATNFAWVYFDGTKDTSGTTSTSNTDRFIYRSYNISNVLRISTGVFRINFSNPASSEFYAAVGTANSPDDASTHVTAIRSMSSVGLTIFTGSPDDYGQHSGTALDIPKVSWIIVQ